MIERKPVLYCLMREDVPDMNPGKGMAQAMHAQSIISKNYADAVELLEIGCKMSATRQRAHEHFVVSYQNWLKEGNGFGTTIVLRATKDHAFILTLEEYARATATVVDPTYPFRNIDGNLFVMEMTTCYAIFVYDDTPACVIEELSKLELY